MVVSGRRNGGSQQPLIVVHRLNDRRKEQQELGVFVGSLAGGEQVDAGIGGERPVVVLTAAVDAGEGLLVEQAHHAMLGCHPLHDLHGQLVLVGGAVGGGIKGIDALKVLRQQVGHGGQGKAGHQHIGDAALQRPPVGDLHIQRVQFLQHTAAATIQQIPQIVLHIICHGIAAGG